MENIEGIVKESPFFLRDYHSHTPHQLIYAIDDVVTVECLGKCFLAPKNRAIWIPSGCQHKTYSTSQTSFRSLFINAEPSLHPDLHRTPKSILISDILKSLILKICEGNFATKEHIHHSELLLLDEITYSEISSIALLIPPDPKLSSLCQYILENHNQRINVLQASKSVHMGRSSFLRYFKKKAGITFGQWCQQARIVQSMSMLSNGMSIQEVAYSCGYQSASSFCVMFKRIQGCTPSEYLHNQNNA